MQTTELNGLDKIIQSRINKEGVIGGEYIAFIGILITATYLINSFIISHIALWIGAIALGWLAIIGHEKIRANESGYSATRIQKEILSLWAVVGGLAIPTVLVVLPSFLDLYSGLATVSLTYLVLGVGLWGTGAVGKAKEFKLGALSCFVAVFVGPFIPAALHQLFLFVFVMLVGLVIPGIVSKLNENK